MQKDSQHRAKQRYAISRVRGKYRILSSPERGDRVPAPAVPGAHGGRAGDLQGGQEIYSQAGDLQRAGDLQLKGTIFARTRGPALGL